MLRVRFPAFPAVLALSLVGSLPAAAQSGPQAVYVTDSIRDEVLRLEDLDGDRLFNSSAEVRVFYDGDVGSLGTGLMGRLLVDPSTQTVYVADISRKIYTLRDANQDGDANDPGEEGVYFDGNPGGNLSGVTTEAMIGFNLHQGVVWVAVNNTSSAGQEMILRLEDLDQDGDANDAGEAEVYFAPPPPGALNDPGPADVRVGQDGAVYYLETAFNSLSKGGVYRLDDLDQDGTIDPLTEVTKFFSPDTFAPPDYWTLEQDLLGYWYMADAENDVVWRFRDEDGDGVVDPATKAVVLWDAVGSLPGQSYLLDFGVAADGSLYGLELANPPSRLLRMRDVDGDGTIDPVAEVQELYSPSQSPVLLATLRGLALVQAPFSEPTTYCWSKSTSDGCLPTIGAAGTPSSSAGAGFDITGAQLQPGALGLLAYSTSGLSDAPFLGGFLCVAGPLTRLAPQSTGGAAACSGALSVDFNAWVAGGTDPALVAGTLVTAQWWTRDAGDAFASSLSNALGFVLEP